MSDLIPAFMRKIVDLEKLVMSGEADNLQILSAVGKIKDWLAGDRSLQQHRMNQAFLTFLYNSYGDDFESRDDFVAWIKCKLKFAKIKVTEAEINGQKVIFKKFLPFSLSFGKCSQKKHQEFVDRLKEFAFQKWGLKFEDWLSTWTEGENTLQ